MSAANAVTNLQILSQTLSTITLEWDHIGLNYGFEVYRASSSPSNPYTLIGVTAKDIKIYADSSISTGVSYYYKVLALGSQKHEGDIVGHIILNNNEYVIFSILDDYSSEIGIYKDGVYSIILSEPLLKFSPVKSISGRFVINNKGERIIIFVDNHNPIRILNIDSLPFSIDNNYNLSDDNDINKLNLLPTLKSSELSVSVNDSGNLLSGTYYVTYRLSNIDGSKTSFTRISNPQYIFNEENSVSSKSLNVSVSSLDESFDYFEPCVISVIGNVIIAKLLPKIGITSSSLSFSVKDNSGSDIDITELLVNKARYNKAKTVEILNNQIFIANLEEEEPLKYQKYANNIKINYTEETVTIANITNNEDKGFRHGEVYAFYIVFVMNDGSFSRAFHIPGRPSAGTDKNASTYDSDFTEDVLKYQIEDTADNGSGTTNMGFWENKNEVYPTNDEYDGTTDYDGNSISGGVDLQGENVRHHRFPSISHIKDEVYSADSDYWKTKFSRLGIVPSNVVIPDQIKEKIQGYYIAYVKRDFSNSIILGQSLYQTSSRRATGSPGSLSIGTSDQTIYRAGAGTFTIDEVSSDGIFLYPYGGTVSDNERGRFHAFDLLNNKPTISPSYILNELRIETSIGNSIPTIPNSGLIKHSSTQKQGFVNHLQGTVTIPTSDYRFRKITNNRYIPENFFIGEIDNRGGEEHLAYEIEYDTDQLFESINSSTNRTGQSGLEELTYLTNMCQLLEDVYLSVDFQKDLIFTKQFWRKNSSGVIVGSTNVKGGDINIGLYNIICTAPTGADVFPANDADGEGTMFSKLFLCESIDNINLRYSTEDYQSWFYDKDNVENTLDNYNIYKSRLLFYNKSYNFLNAIKLPLIFNTYDEYSYKFKYRIIRGLYNTEVDSQIFNIFVNEYKEMPTHRGYIVGLNVISDKLVIRHQESLFLTQGQISLKSNEINVNLGESEIFAVSPKEIMTSDQGIVGSNSVFNCINTKWGLIIPDVLNGRVYLLNKELQEISKIGMRNYFKDNLTYDPIKIPLTFTIGIVNDSPQNILTVSKNTYPYIYVELFTVGNYIWIEEQGEYVEIEAVYDDIGSELIQIIVTVSPVLSTGSGTAIYDYETDIYSDLFTTDNVISLDIKNRAFVTVGYDDKYDRLLISKKDNKNNPEESEMYKGDYTGQSLSSGEIVRYAGGYKKWNGSSFANLSVSDYKETVDFTLSFLLEENQWISFHSYLPEFYITLRNKLLSYYNNGDDIIKLFYEHNSEITKCIYEDTLTINNFEVTVIINVNPLISKLFYNVNWIALIKDIEGTLLNETFNKLLAETGIHQVDELTLSPYNTINDQGNCRNIKNTWYFNKLKSTPESGDNWYDKNRMIDKFLSITLKYNNTKDLDLNQNSLYLYNVDSAFKMLDR